MTENKYKNEKLLKVGGVEILLRPTFENMANLESAVGSVAHLAWRFTKPMSKETPGATDIAKIIYFSQAAHDKGENKEPLSLARIWELVCAEGTMKILAPLLEFLSRFAVGNDYSPELSETVKKN